jgi:RNA polymerase sigma factor (sigma-70 family)
LPEAQLENLIARAAAGEAQAIEALLARCEPDMQRFAQRVCQTPEDAHDAVQEAMLLMSNRLGELRVIKAFFGWLKTVVIRECLRLKRKAERYVGLHSEDELASELPLVECIDLSEALAAIP